MKVSEFQKRLSNNKKPLVVDMWAPWCSPCRAMEPAFKEVGQKYKDRVDVLKINADQSPEILKTLRVMSIPTVVGFANGKEILRRTGMQSREGLEVIFDSTLYQRQSAIVPPAPVDRLIRSAAGLALILLGWFNGQSWLLMGLGGLLLFSAFYDRCPIYRAIVPRIKSYFQRS